MERYTLCTGKHGHVDCAYRREVGDQKLPPSNEHVVTLGGRRPILGC